jgi:hypothetical protein
MATFEDWKTQYAHRVKLMARFRSLEFAREHLPHDDILREQWQASDDPNEAADTEMAGWRE